MIHHLYDHFLCSHNCLSRASLLTGFLMNRVRRFSSYSFHNYRSRSRHALILCPMYSWYKQSLEALSWSLSLTIHRDFCSISWSLIWLNTISGETTRTSLMHGYNLGFSLFELHIRVQPLLMQVLPYVRVQGKYPNHCEDLGILFQGGPIQQTLVEPFQICSVHLVFH